MKFLVLDSGIGLCHALRLARDGNLVYYWKNWWKPFPCYGDFVSGEGFENIVKVQDFGGYLDKADVIFITDSGLGTFVDWLRNKGYKVFGGSSFDRVELDRRYFHQVLDTLGLRYPLSWNVNGIDKVLDFFTNNPGEYFVKVSTFRGDVETFSAKSAEEAEAILIHLENKIGPMADEFPFVIEQKVEGIEVGVDTIFNGRDYLVPILFTFESFDNTLGKWQYEDSIWWGVLMRIAEELVNTGYRGYLSFEAIYDGEELWLLDPTPRPAYPGSSAIFCQQISDYGKLVYGVANGENVDFEVNSKYAVAINVYTEQNQDRWLMINLEPNCKFWLRRGVNKNGIYLTPGKEGETVAGVVIGEGDTYSEAFEDATRQLDKVSLYGMTYNWGILDSFKKEYIDKLKDYGIEF